MEHPYCEICGCPKIARRTVARTTYTCAYTADQLHKATRAEVKSKAKLAELERYLQH